VAIVTVASLGLGIGAATTVFSVANSLLLRTSSAVTDPAGILSIYTVTQSDPVFGQTSFPDFVSLDSDAASLDAVAALRLAAVQLGEGESGRPVMVEIVTADFFDVLGARPSLGRVFTREEAQPGLAARVTVVSHEFWERTLGGRPEAIGEQIRLDGKLFTIVGVGPEGLKSRLVEMSLVGWVPAGLPGGFYHATDEEIRDRADREYAVLARANPEYSLEQVEAELGLLAGRLHEEYGEAWEDTRAQPLAFRVVGANPGVLPPEFRMAFGAAAAVALAGACLILLIACANVAGLLLAQAHERRQEIAVRAALGAGRRRLVRMLFVESALVALASCGIGVLAARTILTSMGSVALPIAVPLEFDFGLDLRVLLFAVGVSAFACFAFGLLPALSGSRADLVPALKAGHDTPGGGSFRLRRLLVVAQVAASVVLLVGAGLVLRSTANVLSADLGFTTDRIAVVSKDLSFHQYSASDAMVEFRDIAASIAAHPDVEAVALSTAVERVFDDLVLADVRPDGYAAADDVPLQVRMNAVDPGYFSMLQMTLASGRPLTDNDRLGTERVALVNEAFAARYWPGQPAQGRTIRLVGVQAPGTNLRGLNDQLTVVGVVRDPAEIPSAESWSELGASTVVGINAKIWVPLAQHPSTGVVIHAKSRTSAAGIVSVLRSKAGADDVPLIAAQPLEQLISFPMVAQGAVGRAMRWGGAFALVLSFLGIYGIVSFAVTERSREMAIRKAMGARPDQVIRRVMRHGFVLAVWGVGAGLVIAVPLAFLVQAELAAVHPLDPIAFGGGVAVILAAAFLASGLPARRLAGLDPMAVLRDE
jgi:predicted permease